MKKEILQARREKLIDLIGDGIAIIRANPHQTRSHDTEFPYRQNTHLAYLLGFDEPDTILVLNPHAENKVSVFLRPKDELAELWCGTRLGVEKACDTLGVDAAYDIADFEKEFAGMLDSHRKVVLDFFGDEAFLLSVKNLLKKSSANRKKHSMIPFDLVHITPLIGTLQLIKSNEEIELMRSSARINTMAHKLAMSMAKDGVYEYQIQAAMEYIYNREGASGAAYGSIVATGNNANTLHYVTNRDQLKDGQIILIDAGCEYQYYASDVTRSFPVSGKYTSEQKDIYQLVFNAQEAAIEQSKPGQNLGALHQTTSKILAQGLIDLKVLKGSVEENMSNGALRTYFPHGTGHWLGIDVHDQSPYLNCELEEVTLEPGMCFTIEPGLYFNEIMDSTPSAYSGIGVRIEDNILITEAGHENMTSDIPKTIQEVEQACNEDPKNFQWLP
jgi:Xaa-Pro aminopeptidase